MKRLLLILFFLFSSQVFADEIATGFYAQVLPLIGFGVTTTDPMQPEIPLEFGVGYDFNDRWSIEGDLLFLIFYKPYDVSSSAFLARGAYYPIGHRTFSPFLSIGLGGGSVDDNRNNVKSGQLSVGGDVGCIWFFSARNGLMFRISDFYQKSDFVDGNMNVLQGAFLLRHVF